MYFATLVLVSAAFSGLVYGDANINTIPQVQDNFVYSPYTGQWFTQGALAPASWPGSTIFTDWVLTYREQAGQKIFEQDWRSRGKCYNVESSLTEFTPGSFLVLDPIGDVFTGIMRVVATDYSSYSILYGCVQESTVDPSRCDIPWLTVDTRNPNPNLFVRLRINRRLRQIFGFPLSATQLVPKTLQGYCPA